MSFPTRSSRGVALRSIVLHRVAQHGGTGTACRVVRLLHSLLRGVALRGETRIVRRVRYLGVGCFGVDHCLSGICFSSTEISKNKTNVSETTDAFELEKSFGEQLVAAPSSRISLFPGAAGRSGHAGAGPPQDPAWCASARESPPRGIFPSPSDVVSARLPHSFICSSAYLRHRHRVLGPRGKDPAVAAAKALTIVLIPAATARPPSPTRLTRRPPQ